MKYSIIIPVYNVENVIEQTIRNILKQNYDDYEIIVVNDGSTDKTCNIIESIDSDKIKLINKTNGGVSSARNIGIENASGKYVTFIDCDDWISSRYFDVIEKFLQEDKYDVIKFGFVFEYNNHSEKYIISNENKIINKNGFSENLYPEMLCTPKYNAVWNQVIKRSILHENKVFFNKDHIYAEDYEFNLNLYSKISNILILNDCLYHYYINEQGITNTKNINKIRKCYKDAIDIYFKNIKFSKDLGIFKSNVFDRILREIETLFDRMILNKYYTIEMFEEDRTILLEKVIKERIKIKKYKFKFKKILLSNNILYKKICIYSYRFFYNILK